MKSQLSPLFFELTSSCQNGHCLTSPHWKENADFYWSLANRISRVCGCGCMEMQILQSGTTSANKLALVYKGHGLVLMLVSYYEPAKVGDLTHREKNEILFLCDSVNDGLKVREGSRGTRDLLSHQHHFYDWMQYVANAFFKSCTLVDVDDITCSVFGFVFLGGWLGYAAQTLMLLPF